MRGKNIICIEISNNDNNFLSGSAMEYKRELRVDSVSDMIDRVLRRSICRKINTLNIIGHGAPGYQSVGNGSVIIPNDKGLLFQSDTGKLYGDSEKQLQRLIGKFAPGGKIILGGCRVAQGTSGRALLKRISILLHNLPVEAGEEKQYPLFGMEGMVIRAVGESVCVTNAKGVCADED